MCVLFEYYTPIFSGAYVQYIYNMYIAFKIIEPHCIYNNIYCTILRNIVINKLYNRDCHVFNRVDTLLPILPTFFFFCSIPTKCYSNANIIMLHWVLDEMCQCDFLSLIWTLSSHYILLPLIRYFGFLPIFCSTCTRQ